MPEKNKIEKEDNIEKILEKCIKALRGEISIDEMNVINSIYEPLKRELTKGRYNDLTVELYSQSAEILLRKINNLLESVIGKKIKNNFEFYKSITNLSDDELAKSIEFFQDIPDFPIPLTKNFLLKSFNDLVINRSTKKRYVKDTKLVTYFPKKEEIILVEEELNRLYERLKSINKKIIKYKELLKNSTWDEASSTLILLGYLAHQGKIDMKQDNFPNGEIYITLIDGE
ncbi:MAG: hypothetical protein ACTSPY_17260 [Candidatus Helarchaeota archaeon]